MHKKTILIIGEVFLDTHLDIIDVNGPLVRLGGIFHSARACAAIGIEYALAYYAPLYMEDDINHFSFVLNTKGCHRLGIIDKAPNVMLINESKEIGDQGYYNIIKDQAKIIEIGDIQEIIYKVRPTDIIIFPGRYNTNKIIKDLSGFEGNIHIDYHYDSEDILLNTETKITTISISTSSSLFKHHCNGELKTMLNYFKHYNIELFLVKENRGGAYCYSVLEEKIYESPAYYIPTMHSVGVGDVYSSVFISNLNQIDLEKNMKLSSLCASQYAGTMYYEKFESNIKIILRDIEEWILLEGTRLSWDERKDKNIYIAAPDFPHINTDILDKLVDCLNYHNFVARLPIKENGLVNETTSLDVELRIYQKDIELLSICDLLIAVLLFNDPGTLVELGMFQQSGKPTIIFDPYNICDNMFVKNTPNFMCKTIGQVIDATFQCLKRRWQYGRL